MSNCSNSSSNSGDHDNDSNNIVRITVMTVIIMMHRDLAVISKVLVGLYDDYAVVILESLL
jgi:hypothetical protein